MKSNVPGGVISLKSSHSVEETVRRAKDLLTAKGVTLFALIDHSGEAEKAGLHMPNTKLLIFGNPNAGTPIMVAVPGAALDLPLKLLVSEDSAGMVWLSYSSAGYLQVRHNIPQALMPALAVVEDLAKKAGAAEDSLAS